MLLYKLNLNTEYYQICLKKQGNSSRASPIDDQIQMNLYRTNSLAIAVNTCYQSDVWNTRQQH